MTTLDTLLAEPGILILPGVHDALSARLAAQAGARALYMTGFGVVGASFGVPDIGLIGPEAMTERVRAIAAASAPVPLIADGDNGHGNPLNAARLARAFEQAGAAAIQLEDQVSPKRCGHMEGKEVVPLAGAAANIRAAASARSTPSFKIVARTDARATHDLNEALRRAEAFQKAGADILFIEAPQSEDELHAIARAFKGVPLLANMVEGGKTPLLPPKILEDIGFKIALYPITALLSAAKHLQILYAKLLADPASASDLMDFAEYNNLMGLDSLRAAAQKHEQE